MTGLSFRIAWFRPQELVQVAAGFPDFVQRSCVLHRYPPGEAYPSTGDVGHLSLHLPQAEPIPRDELKKKGPHIANALTPNHAVFAAAERAFELIRSEAEPWFDEWSSYEALRPIAERGDPVEIAKLCPTGSERNWIGVAWTFEPEWARRLPALQRERCDRLPDSTREKTLAVLNLIEAAMPAW